MTICTLVQAPEPAMAGALEKFEREFTYPLGAGLRFSVSHGRDYPRFFRAIGGDSAASFVAVKENGEILGTLGVAIRPVQRPDGGCQVAAYLGDLKTAPGPSRGRALLRLAAAVTAWSKARGAVIAYGVVMDGTPSLPSSYTGKFGVHAFHKAGEICALRLPAEPSGVPPDGAFETETSDVDECFQKLGAGAFTPLGGFPAARSASPPAALVAPDRSACGILEDTRQAKRLLMEDGREIAVAHLSKFAWSDPPAGVRLIRQALARCAERSLAPAMFVAVPGSDRLPFTALLGDLSGIVVAPASIYGTGLELAPGRWNVSVSEI